jgi:hypothetical protein
LESYSFSDSRNLDQDDIMGRTSKFSFPLPGRKPRSNGKTQGGGQPQAEEPKLSKAERLLGATGLPINNRPQHPQQHHVYKDLRKQPSSLSLAIYEPSLFEDGELEPQIPDISTMPAMPNASLPQFHANAGQSRMPPRSMSLNQKQTARKFQEAEQKHTARAASNGNVPSAAQFKPEINIGQQYPLKAFPSISEIPPSSPRRRGENNSAVMNGYAPWQSQAPRKSFQSVREMPSSPEQGDRKRPSRLDLSKLFPRSSNSNTSTPTQTLVKSPPFVASIPQRPEVLASRMHAVEIIRNAGKHQPLTTVRSAQWSKPQQPMSFSRPRTSGDREIEWPSGELELLHPVPKITRPQFQQNTKNWFDGLLEAEDAVDEEEWGLIPDSVESEEPQNQHNAQDMSIRIVEQSSPYGASQAVSPPMTDKQLRRQSWQTSYTQPFKASSIEVQNKRASIHSSMQSPNLSMQSRHSVATLKTPVRSQFSRQHDLHENDAESFAESEYMSVRDSIALSEMSEDFSIGEAQALHVGTGQFMNRSGRSSQEDDEPMVAPAVQPIQSPPEVDMRTPPMPQTEHEALGLQLASPITSSFEYAASPPPLKSPLSPTRSESRNKMMAVTEEEEALLEMMRQKRAAMASSNFAAGYKTALMSSPQSPMFMNAKRESLGAHSSKSGKRSRSSRPSPLDYNPDTVYNNIDPPLSPPPRDVLPSPPEYGEEVSVEDSKRSNTNSMLSPSAGPVNATNSKTVSLVIANLDPSHPQYAKHLTGELPPHVRFQYMANSPANSSAGSGLSLSLTHSSANSNGAVSVPRSPVTPQAPPANMDYVMVAGGSSSSGSNASLEDMMEQRNQPAASQSTRRQQDQYRPSKYQHKHQVSTNTIINLDNREDAGDIEHQFSDNSTPMPMKELSDFDKQIIEIRTRTLAATNAAIKSYQINSIRSRSNTLAKQRREHGGSEHERTLSNGSAGSGSQYSTPQPRSPVDQTQIVNKFADIPAFDPQPKSPIHVLHSKAEHEQADLECSVADDVMEAWGNLGGWTDLERYREYGSTGAQAA